MRRTIVLLVSLALAVVVASGVALAAEVSCSGGPCYGTKTDDQITGSTGNDVIYALQGADHVVSGGGYDYIHGGSGDDVLSGNPVGDVSIYGASGNDTITGRGGFDRLAGGDGNDTIYANQGITYNSSYKDSVYGDGGNDTIHADDGFVDAIRCGKGTDVVFYDAQDVFDNGGSITNTPTPECENATLR